MTPDLNDTWYVLVDEQSYGPFTSDVMVGFVAEKRVVATSLISRQAQDGYVAAANFPIFRNWLHGMATPTALTEPQTASIEPMVTPQPMTTVAPNPQTYAAPKATHGETIYIIMAEVDLKTGMSFLRNLQSFGYAQRIGDTVWLLQTSQNLSTIKSTLAATMTKRDRLFIHDCFANQQSWENIGADLDERIRQMWQSLKR